MSIIEFQCEKCSKIIAVDKKLVGGKAFCSHCGYQVLVPVPAETQEEQKVRLKSNPTNRCPNCGAYLEEGSVLCLVCGLDKRTNRRIKGPSRYSISRAFTILANTLKLLLLLAITCIMMYFGYYSIAPYFNANKKPIAANVLSLIPNAVEHAQKYAYWSEYRKQDWFDGNAFDFISWVFSKDGTAFSIDPEIAKTLSGINILIKTEPTLKGYTLIAEQLKPYSIILKQTSLTSNQVVFITTPAAWAYCVASSYLKVGQNEKARQILSSLTADSTPFAEQCRALKEILDLEAECDSKINKHNNVLQESIHRIKLNIAAQRTAYVASAISLEHGGSANAFRQVQIDALYQEIRTCSEQFKAFVENLFNYNERFAKRFVDAYEGNLLTEASHILNRQIFNFDNLKRMENDIKYSGLDDAYKHREEKYISALDNNANSLEELQQLIRQRVRYSEMKQDASQRLLDSHSQNMYKGFSRALSVDSSLLSARIGCGYAHAREDINALYLLFSPSTSNRTAQWKQDAERKYTVKGNTGRLALLKGITNSPDYALRSQIGTINGLAITETEGKLFPVTVSSELRTTNKIRMVHTQLLNNYCSSFYRTVSTTYIDQKELELYVSDPPFYFSDYGDKDLSMIAMTWEAYRWLQGQDELGTLKNVSLRIGFHEIFYDKAGDSASAAMAIGGYSVLKKKPIRQDVAMTGSIRSDGRVKEIGGIAAKIGGAFASPGIEMVIVPKANEKDLLALPIEQLCNLTIIVTDDIQTYIKYAVAGSQQTAVNTALVKLQKAQFALMSGDLASAYKELQIISGNNPEIYSATRLLTLMRLYGKETNIFTNEVKKNAQGPTAKVLKKVNR